MPPNIVNVTKHKNVYNHFYHYQAIQPINSEHITRFPTFLTKETEDIYH